MDDRCSIGGCTNPPAVTFYGYPICQKHWARYDEDPKFDLKKILKVKEPIQTEVKSCPDPILAPQGPKCIKCKDIISKVKDGVKCSRCGYAQYKCPKCGRKFNKHFALTNHRRRCD